MTNPPEPSDLQERLSTLGERIERHGHVVAKIADTPDGYDLDQVETYLDALDAALGEADEALEPLAQATDQAAEALLEEARVLIDGEELDGVEVTAFDDDSEVMEATLLVESPKVNQLRGGLPVLALGDGREFTFKVLQTLIADVGEDKTGHLELVLGLREA
jgi:hypothetical protein